MNFESINYNDYEIKTPYPKLTTTQKDEAIIPDLIYAYSGSKGELTAITQYIYQSFIVKPNNNYLGLSRLLEQISIKEMHHLELLSQILISQGINPKFCRYIENNYDICSPWSSSNVNYITDVKDFIKYNIEIENDAINEYRQIVQKSQNDNISEIILRIIEDEESHIQIFTKILEILQQG